MTSRAPFAIALVATAFYAGVFVTAAHAEMHYVRVTLITGQQLTITVEVPPGTPVDQVQIPGLPAPVSSIVDLGSAEGTPTPLRHRGAHGGADHDGSADRRPDGHCGAQHRHVEPRQGQDQEQQGQADKPSSTR